MDDPALLTLSGLSQSATYEKVRRWYLARLRKSALGASADPGLTPARLIAIDKDYVEKMILEQPSTMRKARLRETTFDSVSTRIAGQPLAESIKRTTAQLLLISLAVQVVSFGIFLIMSSKTLEIMPVLVSLLITGAGFGALFWYAFRTVDRTRKTLIGSFDSATRKEIDNVRWSGTREIDILAAMTHELSHQATEAQTREEAIADHALDLIFALDRKARVVSVSPSSNRILGYAPSHLEGKHISLIVSPDDTKRIEELISHKEKSNETTLEIAGQTQDGATVYLSWFMEWSNTEHVMFCSARDITLEKESERILRQSEANMRTLIDNMPIGLVTLDRDGCIDATNPRTREIFGYDQTELTGAHPQILFGEREGSREQYVDKLARDTFGKLHELRATKKNGDPVFVETSSTTIRTPRGERLLVTIVDVSDRQELEKLKRRFVALVSHELRTPLTSIHLFLELLVEEALGPVSEKIIKRSRGVIDHVKRLLNLVEDLLSVENMASGQFTMRFEPLSLDSVTQRSIGGVDELAKQAGVVIETDHAQINLIADEDRLVQALINLISNAIKFSRRGSTVKITARKDEDWVEMRVIDEGAGIAPTVAAGLFQPFRQSPDERARKTKRGSGLGLYICKVIVEQHGGLIGLDSEEGKGSSFWLRLPIGGPPSQAAEQVTTEYTTVAVAQSEK